MPWCGRLDPSLGEALRQAPTETILREPERAGRGLAGVPLLDDQLAEGLLVCALPSPPVERDRFYLVQPRRDDADPALALFCDWLRAEASAVADWRGQGNAQ